MQTIKRISVDIGDSFEVVSVLMNGGDEVKVIHTVDDESHSNWVCEAGSRNEVLETMILGYAKKVHNYMLNAIAGEA